MQPNSPVMLYTDLKKDSESLSDKVFSILESGILNATYPSGMSLNECDIAESLNVSRSPVREALVKLESAGLAKRTKRGRVVAEIGPDDIQHSYEIWQMVESFAAARGCLLYNDTQMQAIQQAFDALVRHTQTGNVEEYRKANFEFHASLVAPCRNPYLVSFYQSAINRVKWASLYSLEEKNEIVGSVSGHREILEAYRMRLDKKVYDLISVHILNAEQRTTNKYFSRMKTTQK